MISVRTFGILSACNLKELLDVGDLGRHLDSWERLSGGRDGLGCDGGVVNVDFVFDCRIAVSFYPNIGRTFQVHCGRNIDWVRLFSTTIT